MELLTQQEAGMARITDAAAFERWMQGEPYSAIKKQAKRPLMKVFQKIGGGTWKQLQAKRKQNRKATSNRKES